MTGGRSDSRVLAVDGMWHTSYPGISTVSIKKYLVKGIGIRVRVFFQGGMREGTFCMLYVFVIGGACQDMSGSAELIFERGRSPFHPLTLILADYHQTHGLDTPQSIS